MVFQAFALLTGLITIQLVPLNRLGEEQSEDIERMNQADSTVAPCVINAETKQLDPEIYQDIAASKYQHLVIGLEQASHPDFRKILRDPELRNRIGLVVIDEVHLVCKWERFRPEYVQIYELHTILRRDTIWLGASATVSKETEEFVLSHAGFRAVGERPYQTKIIRSSIDRPDITYILKTIPKERLGDYDMLYFILKHAVTTQGDAAEATPEQIQKTMVFIDGRKHVQNLVDVLRQWLVEMTKASTGRKYTFHSIGNTINVCKVIQLYTSTVAKHNQEVRYTTFSQPTSEIRVMVITTALSTGLNVPDVKCVIQWKFPTTRDLEDVMQRLGRVGRAQGLQGKAFLFLPCYIDNSIKQSKPKTSSSAA